MCIYIYIHIYMCIYVYIHIHIAYNHIHTCCITLLYYCCYCCFIVVIISLRGERRRPTWVLGLATFRLSRFAEIYIYIYIYIYTYRHVFCFESKPPKSKFSVRGLAVPWRLELSKGISSEIRVDCLSLSLSLYIYIYTLCYVYFMIM